MLLAQPKDCLLTYVKFYVFFCFLILNSLIFFALAFQVITFQKIFSLQMRHVPAFWIY